MVFCFRPFAKLYMYLQPNDNCYTTNFFNFLQVLFCQVYLHLYTPLLLSFHRVHYNIMFLYLNMSCYVYITLPIIKRISMRETKVVFCTPARKWFRRAGKLEAVERCEPTDPTAVVRQNSNMIMFTKS